MNQFNELFYSCGITPDQFCTICDITRSTFRRYQTGKSTPPGAVIRLLEIKSGAMPWPGWEKFTVKNGAIYGPGSGRPVVPRDIAFIDIDKQRLKLLERENAAPAQYFLDL